jgi:hypothetical protein
MRIPKPAIGQWYRPHEKGDSFQVIAFDESSGTIEMQHFDGDIEEWDAESWRLLAPELIETPEDWTGPMDDIEPDDLGYSEAPGRPEDRDALSEATLEQLEPEASEEWEE